MSLVKDLLVKSLAEEGELLHDFTIKNLTFVLKEIETEEQILADGLVDLGQIREKHDAKNHITLDDMIRKMRAISQITFAIKTINGKPPVDPDADLKEQYKARLELRDELLGMGTAFVDRIILEFNDFAAKQREFYKNHKDNLEKS